ncbi:unnamed protein product [Urochloa decumbens]
MEVQMAAQAAKSTGHATPPHHHAGGKAVPGYLRPPAGSCHHVCKYGGTHAFEDKETPTAAKKKPGQSSKPRKQPAAAPAAESQSGRVMGKVRSVFRRRVGDSSRAADKAAKGNKGGRGGGESVEWKDIVAYDTTTVTTPVIGSGDAKKKDVVVKGNTKSHDKPSKGVQAQDETLDKKSAKPPKGKKPTTSLLVTEKMAIDPELLLHGYQVLSPSLIQSRATLLRDLEEEMVHEAIITKEEKPKYTLDEEEEYIAAAAAGTSRPIPAHRRAKSMSMSISSRSVRYPFIRQARKNSSGGTFKLRSRSTKAPMAPPPEEETAKKPARLRSRRGSEDASSGSATGRGIQLRIRSLRRRGVGGGSGGAGTGFVVPAVALRHQKTLEKKKSQRLYNGVIEETASKLVKTRKSRVKALVGAFESVISKIAK